MTPSSLPPAAGTRRLLPLAAALATALLLVACASPGPAHQPLATSTAQAAGLPDAASQPAAARWWRALGDRQHDALVAQALQGSPSLAVGRARLAQAVALSQVREAGPSGDD